MVQHGFVEMRVQSLQGCPLEWAMVVAGSLDLPETRRSCGSWPGGVVDGVTGVLLVVRPVDGPQLGSYVGEVLPWWWCEASGTVLPNSRWCGEVRRADENLARLSSDR